MLSTSAAAMSSPRLTTTGLPEKWATNAHVVLDPSLEDLAPGAGVEIADAMLTWLTTIQGLPVVTFEQGATRATAAFDGVNVILAGPITVPGNEKDLALTTTYASDDTGDILEVDVVFNTAYAYALMPTVPVGCNLVYDLGAVATHESGHFFGLGEDYVDDTTTMFVTTGACDPHKRTLTPPDTVALDALYAQGPSVGCDAAPVRANGGELLLAALALIWRKRRQDP
jgi:hypothetical protein